MVRNVKKDDIYDIVESILKNKFQCDSIKKNINLEKIGLDSLDMVEFLLTLEEEFNIEFDTNFNAGFEKSFNIKIEEIVDKVYNLINV